MAYSGSTAASSVANPPILQSRLAGGRTVFGTSRLTAWSSGTAVAPGIGIWSYTSTNLTTDLTGAGFFTDGHYLGMQVGDMMHVVQYTSAGSSFIVGTGVLITTNSTAGYNLSTGSFITSTH